MKVSVIVPVYNVEAFLPRCLDSLIRQTFNDYEIICVNDCSPDESQAILDDYAGRYPQLIRTFTNPENIGLGRTREKALEHATGEYILFIDSDDYVAPDYIQTYIDALGADDYDLVIGGYIRDAQGKLTEHLPSDSIWSTVTYALACTKLIKKAFIEEHRLRFTGVACGEDIYFSLSAFYYGATYKVIPYAGYYYYLNKNSITGSMTFEKNHERMMAEMFSTFLHNHDISVLSEQQQRIIEYTYLANMVNALVVFNRGCGIKRMREKYSFVMNDLHEKFPAYASNPYAGILKPKGQTAKIRIGVGIPFLLSKVHLDRFLFYAAALLK